MAEDSYKANFDSAIAYLRIGQNDHAKESIQRAFSQVSEEDKNADNTIYLKILALSARFEVEKRNYAAADAYLVEGLNLKDDHADLLFIQSLICMDRQQYGEMFGLLIKYLLSLGEDDVEEYDYDFANQSALNEVMGKLLPLAYRNAPDHPALTEVVEKLRDATGNTYLQGACDLMQESDKLNSAE